MAELAISCRHVTKHYGDTRAVDRVDLTLENGKFLALLGPSGCGKTTTLRLIAGFEVPDSGTIEVGGRAVVGSGSFVAPEKRRVGMVFQDYALFPHLDVARNVAYGLGKGADRARRVEEVLELVGLGGLGSRMPHELSGGQQQRVALARALAPEPDVILLDEPFSNLDAALRARVRAEVRQILYEAGATAVFVTHDQEEALSLADEVAMMWRGRVVQKGSPEELYRYPANREVAAFVGDADFLPGEVRNGLVSYELGSAPAADAVDGEVEVMLRPESVELVPDDAGPAVVVLRQFFGHDELVTVRLGSGKLVRARLGPENGFHPGRRVRVSARDRKVMAFPRSDPGGEAVLPLRPEAPISVPSARASGESPARASARVAQSPRAEREEAPDGGFVRARVGHKVSACN